MVICNLYCMMHGHWTYSILLQKNIQFTSIELNYRHYVLIDINNLFKHTHQYIFTKFITVSVHIINIYYSKCIIYVTDSLTEYWVAAEIVGQIATISLTASSINARLESRSNSCHEDGQISKQIRSTLLCPQSLLCAALWDNNIHWWEYQVSPRVKY